MEKLYSALCLWIVLYTHSILNFLSSRFSKPNNIKIKSSTEVRSYFQIKVDREIDIYSTLDPHGHKGWRKDGKTS